MSNHDFLVNNIVSRIELEYAMRDGYVYSWKINIEKSTYKILIKGSFNPDLRNIFLTWSLPAVRNAISKSNMETKIMLKILQFINKMIYWNYTMENTTQIKSLHKQIGLLQSQVTLMQINLDSAERKVDKLEIGLTKIEDKHALLIAAMDFQKN